MLLINGCPSHHFPHMHLFFLSYDWYTDVSLNQTENKSTIDVTCYNLRKRKQVVVKYWAKEQTA